ncbi:GAF domain-containing protein [Solirubrobacter ginsenosidimutans]|uniref:histidine kinase n=1 Tax=Solirubrobacter ginsenosidimutans TaxID=490573 RepID=A0A9X3S3F5_9ACTN|nr:GAF domain-containing protein [Solirubrobacter ginsenosidimutans]MDA0165675.1 GAF domain-containing protein [Solirubrobacter ginsenosidimutans]
MSGDELNALRRIARRVASGAPQDAVFATVLEEVGRGLAVDYARIGRYEPDDTLTVVASWGDAGVTMPRTALGGRNLATIVFDTGRPARIDGYGDASGALGIAAREAGVRAAVGTPVIVEGRLWGLIVAGSRGVQALAADAELRLASFTELVATTIANADSRAGVTRLAADQAALRRVATLVARGVAPEEVFAAVVEEVGRLLPVDFADLGRCEPDGTITFVAGWGKTRAVFPVGARLKLGGKNATTLVAQTGGPVRVESYADASGEIGGPTAQTGVRSAVGTPVTVDGRLWGVMAAGWSLEEPMPADTVPRLAQFTDLLETAVANAESRAALARVANEQAALRRVATLVARGVAPDEIFAAVAEEVGRLLAADLATMCRYEPDRTMTMLAAWGSGGEHFPVGSRWPLGGRNLATLVFETGRPVRLEPYAEASGPVGLESHNAGIDCAVGTPIVVEDRLWGAVAVASTTGRRLPPDTDERLTSFTELVGTALANAESRAELMASRARIVAAADEERRRVVRDLHDGAQQRLVHTIVTLKLASGALEHDREAVDDLVRDALDNAEQANRELRELAHGILPTVLVRGGLSAAVDALASRMQVPVETDVAVDRLPATVEATAHFVVAEALTNVAKHARAGHAAVAARIEGGALVVQVRDDGVGGARLDGSGLMGLADRLAVLEGRLRIESPAAGGTLVSASIPLPS